jgi:CRISPR-associated exonuclease Cas4
MCLEEMHCCAVPEGALFYGETRRREIVRFTDELRAQVSSMLSEMHVLYERGHTPRVKPTASCRACSLKELCLPKLMRIVSASAYIAAASREEEP